MEEGKISHEAFEGVLLDTDQATHQGRADILWCERDGIRIVILDRLAETFIAQAQAAYFRSGAGARNAFFPVIRVERHGDSFVRLGNSMN